MFCTLELVPIHFDYVGEIMEPGEQSVGTVRQLLEQCKDSLKEQNSFKKRVSKHFVHHFKDS